MALFNAYIYIEHWSVVVQKAVSMYTLCCVNKSLLTSCLHENSSTEREAWREEGLNLSTYVNHFKWAF